MAVVPTALPGTTIAMAISSASSQGLPPSAPLRRMPEDSEPGHLRDESPRSGWGRFAAVRRLPGPPPARWRLIPVLALVSLLAAGCDLPNFGAPNPRPEQGAEVDVIGFQWSWQFRYPDEDITITGEPGEPPEMVIPVDRPTSLNLIAADVAHSFWVPDFLSKRDLIPGVDNEIDVTPTEEGTYVGRCAEYCGLDHWRMNYAVRVVSQDEYDDWIAEQRAAQADDGADDTGDNGDDVSGEGSSS